MFHPFKKRFEGWRLVDGEYQPLAPDAQGHMQCSTLDLSLGVLDGWLRWFARDEGLLLIGSEIEARADADRKRAEAEMKRLQDEIRRLRGEG